MWKDFIELAAGGASIDMLPIPALLGKCEHGMDEIEMNKGPSAKMFQLHYFFQKNMFSLHLNQVESLSFPEYLTFHDLSGRTQSCRHFATTDRSSVSRLQLTSGEPGSSSHLRFSISPLFHIPYHEGRLFIEMPPYGESSKKEPRSSSSAIQVGAECRCACLSRRRSHHGYWYLPPCQLPQRR